LIALSGVGKAYDDKWVVRDVDLVVEPGEIVVLVGTSGCGKTTTLKMINRLVEPSCGGIRVGGEDVLAVSPVVLRRRIGYVFQGIGLFPHLTIAENAGVVPDLLGWSAGETAARVSELLELVGLPEAQFAARYPSELSGGQRQRVGFARALAARPKVLLMDEPFGALDPITRDALQTEYRRLHKEMGLTAILVTHDMAEALLLADRVAVMDAGNIVQCASPQTILRDPANAFVEEMLQTPLRQARALTEASA
jgi:osmoprotectant transport system ATP-binding protein